MLGKSLLPLLAGAASVLAQNEAKKPSNIVPGGFIVEFEPAEDLSQYRTTLPPSCDTVMEFDYKLFKGASIQFKDHKTAEQQVARLKALGSVKNVWPKQVYTLPRDELQWAGREGLGSESGGIAKRVQRNETTTDSPHIMTQVDKLRAKGITGQGIKIAVIDTGVSTPPLCPGCPTALEIRPSVDSPVGSGLTGPRLTTGTKRSAAALAAPTAWS